MAYLPSLNDEELMRHAQTQFDVLSSTPLEVELLGRLGRLTAEVEELQRVAAVVETNNLDADQITEMFELLDEFNAADPKSLRQKLKRADAWYDLADEAGDLFSRLTALQQATL